MKPLGYILLAALVLQLPAVRGLCAPLTGNNHACCPTAQRDSVPNPSPLPDCCLVALLRDESSIAEVGAALEAVNATAQGVGAVVLPPLRPAVTDPLVSLRIFQPVSPPLTPLLQTCLLLI